MAIGSVLQQGLTGMQQSQRAMLKSANEIVKAGTTAREDSGIIGIVEPLIDMKIQQQVFDASAKIVKVADETVGSLLDIKA